MRLRVGSTQTLQVSIEGSDTETVPVFSSDNPASLQWMIREQSSVCAEEPQ